MCVGSGGLFVGLGGRLWGGVVDRGRPEHQPDRVSPAWQIEPSVSEGHQVARPWRKDCAKHPSSVLDLGAGLSDSGLHTDSRVSGGLTRKPRARLCHLLSVRSWAALALACWFLNLRGLVGIVLIERSSRIADGLAQTLDGLRCTIARPLHRPRPRQNQTMTDRLRHPETDSQGRFLRLVVLVVCSLVGLTALWGIFDAVGGEPRVWGLLGFEVVTLVTAALGVFVGLGRPREAPGLASATIGATVFAAGTLGRFSAIMTRAEGALSEGQAVRALVRDPMFDGRLVAAIVLLAVGACFVLGSDRAAWRKLVIGSVLLIPVLGAGLWLSGSGLDWLMAPVESSGGLVRVVGAAVGGVGLMIAASVSIHLVIRAFEGRLPPLVAGEGSGDDGVDAPQKTGEAKPTKSA